jgi:predicted dehydrogenase
VVRWGFLGAGFIATKALAPAVHAASGAVLQAAAARDADRAGSLGPVGSAYDSYEALLADDSVDAVYISLTNEMHARWSIAAMQAGKHVLCEKPLALSAAEVAQMQQVAVATSRLLVEASWYRWHPRVRMAQDLLRAGRIGAVCHVTAGFTFDGRLAGNYRLEPARGGGALYDVGCYAVSAALWAFGDVPREVCARQQLAASGVDLVTEAVLEFDAGAAEIRAGISEPPRQWLVITGDSGEIELRDTSYTSWVTDETVLVCSDGRSAQRMRVPAVDAYRLMVEDVSAVIEGRDGWVVPAADSLATAAVLDAAFASSRRDGEPTPVRRGGLHRSM